MDHLRPGRMLAEDKADVLMNRCGTPRWYFTMRAAQARVMREAGSFKVSVLCLNGASDVIADPDATARFLSAWSWSSDKSRSTFTRREFTNFFARWISEKVFADACGGVMRARGE